MVIGGPMIVGLGTKKQKSALFEAGCQEVMLIEEIDFWWKYKHMVFASGNTIVMIQPQVLTSKQMRSLVAFDVEFKVPGNAPIKIDTEPNYRKFRQQKPMEEHQNLIVTKAGRPPKLKPTEVQAQSIVELWRTPALKRAAVVERACDIMGQKVPAHWVRDLVIKRTGSAKRSLGPGN